MLIVVSCKLVRILPKNFDRLSSLAAPGAVDSSNTFSDIAYCMPRCVRISVLRFSQITSENTFIKASMAEEAPQQ